MSIKLHLDNLPVTRMAYSYSVLNELLLSLKVLGDHKHYPLHIGWALATRRQLPDGMRREHRFFSLIFQSMLTFLWETGQVEEADFAIELEMLAKRPLAHFTDAIISALLIGSTPTGKRIVQHFTTLATFQQEPTLQSQARDWLATYYPDSIEIVDLLLTNPTALKERFITFIKQYWELVFHASWAEIESFFLQEIGRRGQRLYAEGVIQGLADLMPKMHINEDSGEVIFFNNSEDEERWLGSKDTLNLYPSYFTYPSSLFTFHRDQDERLSVSITYPLPEIRHIGQSPLPPEQLLTTLRAIGDGTRLQILQLVAQTPRSTRELAPIIGLSEAAVSKHLKLLHQAGWVSAERNSYYVLYRASIRPLANMTFALNQLLKKN
ncbi:DUF5937 family protein [Candidatus Leptofilum sp.]|uniref:ArsR/SmtB family transcription factor n=1 Tax=Candidatus Leptofilum sp. TaxID=3241576 RepID=UPI003B5BDAE2